MALTLPGDDWGYPSPFAFYARGPGYVAMSLLFDTLTWKDANGVIPWLAKAWDTSEGGAVWTFMLQPGVTWHDGTPLTADDVAFTYAYFKAQPTAFKWSWPVDKIGGTEVCDTYQVKLTLTEPLASPHEDLFGSLPIIPKHIWEDVEDPAKFSAAKAVIGSGPFQLAEYSKEEARYVYRANPAYFQGAPVVDPLIFIKVENEALALQTGTTDYASFSGKEIDAVRIFENDPRYRIIEGPSFWVLRIIFNTTRSPLDGVAFRRALAHAVDRDKMVQQVTHSGAVVANLGIISPGTDWYNPRLPTYPYDPAQAREILDELEIQDVQLTLITTSDYVREAELVQTDLAEGGIGVTVKTGDLGTVDGLLREGNFDLAISGRGAIANPAALQVPTWPASTYQNEVYDRLYQEQARTMDVEKRRELVWQLQHIVADELPVLTLWHPKMWTVTDAGKLDTWFYTQGGVGLGIPIAMNKIIFLGR